MRERADFRSPPGGVDTVIGRSFVDPDYLRKVAGTYPFQSDIRAAESLFGVVIRSPHPHARVVGIDRAELLGRSGVVAVFTPDDVPVERFNPAAVPSASVLEKAADKRLLTDHPRHIGDGVALIVADTEKNARRAALDPPVEWERLPAVLTVDEALRDGQILVDVGMEDGDVESLIREADVLIDRRIVLERSQHVCLESHACAAAPGLATMTLWTNAQCPSEIRRLVAGVAGIPQTDLRVVKRNEGGGFGNKQEMYEEALIVIAARVLGRPVRLRYSRHEEFTATRLRHGGTLRLRAAFDADGALRATHLEAVLDSGAYASHTPYVLSCVGGHLPILYPRARHAFDGRAVRTHTVPSGAYRGYGVAQAATLAEQVFDEAAQRLRMSPAALRTRNLDGAVGRRLVACLTRLPETSVDVHERPALRGAGIAVAVKSSVTEAISDGTSAWVHIADDMVILGTGTCDSGTGSSLALAQIVAGVLGVADPHSVRVVEGDSANGPLDVGSSAQRSVFRGGFAAHKAAVAARDALLTAAAHRFGRHLPEVRLCWPQVIDRRQDSVLCHVEDLLPGLARRRWHFVADGDPADRGASVCAIRVVVSVDADIGVVSVDEVTAVVDCGVVINPRAAHGQVAGAIGQGIGLALVDAADRGPTPSILNHGAVRTLDVPTIQTIFIDRPGARTPTGLGELAIVATPPAIANAVADAVGVRCPAFPMRPDVIVAAMADGAGR